MEKRDFTNVLCFPQTWYDNMGRAGEASIKSFNGEEYTCITFRPDLPKFKMSILDKDTVALMTRRAYDIAGATKGVRVFFNGKRLPVSSYTISLSHCSLFSSHHWSVSLTKLPMGLFFVLSNVNNCIKIDSTNVVTTSTNAVWKFQANWCFRNQISL